MAGSSKRALELPSDRDTSPMQMRPLAPPAGGEATAVAGADVFMDILHAQTPLRYDPVSSVKQRVKELENLLEKAREELKESEAEKFTISTPTATKTTAGAEDELGADEMVKSPGLVAPPPGMDGEAGGMPTTEHTGASRGSYTEETGQSSKDGRDPMQDAKNDDWAKAKEREARGKEAPDWVWAMIIQQQDTMKLLQAQVEELKAMKGPQSPIGTTTTPNLSVNAIDKPLAAIDKKIIDKPNKYDGSIAKFPEWQDSFIDYVGTHDDRWRTVLDCISSRKSAITEQDMLNIAIEA